MALVFLDARVELAPRKKVHQLGKHELTFEHKTSREKLARKYSSRTGSSVVLSSDRVQTLIDASCFSFKAYFNRFGH
jgi:hypothetical protein